MNELFKYFTSRNDDRDPERVAYTSWFISTFPISEFKEEEFYFYSFMDFCSKLERPCKLEYLEYFLSTEVRALLAKSKVKVKGTESITLTDPLAFETVYKTTCEVLRDNTKVLEQLPAEIDDFVVEVQSFMVERRNQRLTQALSDVYSTLGETHSAVDATNYALEQITIINDIYSAENLEDLVSANVDASKFEFITDTGLPAIDKDSGGIYQTQLLGIEAQPGTGKTRLAVMLSYRAATLYNKAVLFIPLEQSKFELECMYVALHMFYLYNVQVSDDIIRKGKLPDDLKPLYEAAKIDLFESGKYGKIVIHETVLYVENFIAKITNLDKLQGPFDLIVIDYMGLMESNGTLGNYKYKDAYLIIKDAYKLFKRYLRKVRKGGIAVAQFNDKGIEAGKADKTIETNHAEGGIAVYRNTDYNLAISMTEAMRAQQKRRFSQPKVRSTAGFGTFIADTRLGFCYFKQATNANV